MTETTKNKIVAVLNISFAHIITSIVIFGGIWLNDKVTSSYKPQPMKEQKR